MVSIPDWSRLGRLLDNSKSSQSAPRSNKYHRQREADDIKQAEKHGYFLLPTKEFLEETFLPEPEPPPGKKVSILDEIVQDKDISEVYFVMLARSHVRMLGDVGMCSFLRVCILNNNYVTRFEALGNCQHLIKLDLHSNQISMLPGPSFWSNLIHLKILNLHDNPIGRIDNLQSLAYSNAIIALTMYDTPLSLKRNYRHHMVNSLWTLKALDHYVVADDEIIEDAQFGGRFRSMSLPFSIQLSNQLPEDAEYRDHLMSINNTITEINTVLSHHSPVLIIQRWMRGYLTRKYTKTLHDTIIWASVIIQRKYRTYKGWKLPEAYSNIPTIPPPPSTPSLAVLAPEKDEAIPEPPTQTPAPPTGTPQHIAPPASSPQHIVPPASSPQHIAPPAGSPQHIAPPAGSPQHIAPPAGSPQHIAPPAGSPQQAVLPPQSPAAPVQPSARSGILESISQRAETPSGGAVGPNTATDIMKVDYDSYLLNRRPGSTTYSEAEQTQRLQDDYTTKRKNLLINMTKLQSGTLVGLQNEATDLDTARNVDNVSRLSVKSKSKVKRKEEGKRVKDTKQFFGEVIDAISTPEPCDLFTMSLPNMDPEEEIPVVGFRLQGYREKLRLIDPTADMIITRQEAARDVKLAEAEHHRVTAVAHSMPPKKAHPFSNITITTDHRLFSRVQGTMGLSCLHAVQQAYKDRERAEVTAAKMSFVLHQKELRQAAKQRIRLYQEEKRSNTLKSRVNDKKHFLDELERQTTQTQNMLSKNQDVKTRSSIHTKQVKRERTFTNDFNIQNTSVSNALMRHDKQAILDDRGNTNLERVQSVKAAEREQRKIVSQYMEHRKTMRQTEGSVSRAALDAKMLQEANDQLMAARSRVAQQKARSANVRAAHPMQTTQPLPPIVDDKTNSRAMLQRWNTVAV